MPLDRIVMFEGEGEKTAPTKKNLQLLLEDYLQGLGTVRWDSDRFFCDLPGACHAALIRQEGARPLFMDGPRWIEVWRDKRSVYVMTRQQDEVTNAIAEGLAEIITRWFQGNRED